MDNQNPTPPTENIPPQNPTMEASPPTPKSFLSTKIILLIVMVFILIVGSGTYLALNSKPKPQPIVPQLTPTPSPTPIDKTTNWKTYTNGAFGFSFKYPDTTYAYLGIQGEDEKRLNIELLRDGLDKETIPSLQIGISVFEESASLEEFINREWQRTSISVKKSKKQNLTIGKIHWYTITQEPNVLEAVPNTQSKIYFTKNGNFIFMLGYYEQNQLTNANVEIFDQILSTFKFLDTSPTPTCRPRPACLDATPKCLIEIPDMCPPTITPSP